MVAALTKSRAMVAYLRRRASKARAKAWANFEAAVYAADNDATAAQVRHRLDSVRSRTGRPSWPVYFSALVGCDEEGQGVQYRILTLVFALIGNASSAQEDLLACVDPDVREGLLFRTTEMGASLSRTVPDELADLPDADALEFIGSSVSSFLSIAAYRTPLAPTDAMNTAAAMLGEAGWREFELGMSPSGGFVTGNEPQVEVFCRDGSMLNVVGDASGDTTYVRLQLNANRDGVPCDALPGGPPGMIARLGGGPGIFEHLPTLALPDGTAPLDRGGALVASPAGFSGSDRSASTQIELETALPAQEVAEDFGRQLEAQGWSLDAGWSGEYSSGSGWTRSSSGGLDLTGLLDVIALGGTAYRASFRVSVRDAD